VKIKGLLIIFLISLVLLCTSCSKESESYDIVATIFPGYDFARALSGDELNIKQLLPPGSESHSYEVSARDIIAIQKCKIFICVGGESEDWVDSILDSMDEKPRVIRMMDCVSVLDEEIKEGMDHDEHDHGDGKYDEHVWTSPKNAVLIVENIRDAIAEEFPETADSVRTKAGDYIASINELDASFEALFERADDTCLIFGDRFPLRYFVERYGIDYYAAFPGCSADSEVSASTVAFLIDKVREEGIGAVYFIEFSNEKMADVIVEDTGCKKLLFHSCHNVSAHELEAGVSYLSLMEQNLESLKEGMS